MARFKDALSREWTIFLTSQEIRELRKQLNVNLLDFAAGDAELVNQIASDPVLLVDIVSIVLTEQIQKAGLNERQFAEGLVGVGIENAVDALIEAIADFSGPRKGAILRQLWAKNQTAQTAAMDRASVRIAEMDVQTVATEKVDQAFDEAVRKFGGSSSKPPQSPESSPGYTPSES